MIWPRQREKIIKCAHIFSLSDPSSHTTYAYSIFSRFDGQEVKWLVRLGQARIFYLLLLQVALENRATGWFPKVAVAFCHFSHCSSFKGSERVKEIFGIPAKQEIYVFDRVRCRTGCGTLE